jgi:hypothetical protein
MVFTVAVTSVCKIYKYEEIKHPHYFQPVPIHNANVHVYVCGKSLAYYFVTKLNSVCDLHFSEMLHKADWWLVTNVLRQPIGPIFKAQVAHEKCFSDCLTLDNGTDRLS